MYQDKPHIAEPLYCHHKYDVTKMPVVGDWFIEIAVHCAVTNKHIPDAMVVAEQGNYSVSARTNGDGKVRMRVSHSGKYKVTVSKEGWVSGKTNTVVKAVKDVFVAKAMIGLSPPIEDDTVRIILDWNEKPDDMDLHLYQANTARLILFRLPYYFGFDR